MRSIYNTITIDPKNPPKTLNGFATDDILHSLPSGDVWIRNDFNGILLIKVTAPHTAYEWSAEKLKNLQHP